MSFFDQRNNFRKVYSTRREPQRLELYSASYGAPTYVFDSNTILRHRDYFIIRDANAALFVPAIITSSIYDEGLIFLNNEDIKTVSYGEIFTVAPYIVVNLEPGTGSTENIIPYLISVSSSSFVVGVSALHTGYLRYRALYAPTFPTTVITSGVPTQYYAGAIAMLNADVYTASYSMPGTPPWIGITPFDYYGYGDVDVYTTSGSFTASSFNGILSAKMTNSIYFIMHE